jgi:glutamate dehydrogenase
VFDARTLWKHIEALDNRIQAEVQYLLMFQISRMLRRSVYWFLHRHPADLAVEPVAERLRPGVTEILGTLAELESERGKRRLEKDIQHLLALGVDQDLASRIAAMTYMVKTLDIVEVATLHGLPPGVVARVYFQLGRGLRFDWLRSSIEKLNVEGRWQAMARGTLRENVARQQRALLERVISQRGKLSPDDALVEWLSGAKSDISRIHRTLEDMRDAGSLDFATLSVAIKEIERLI